MVLVVVVARPTSGSPSSQQILSVVSRLISSNLSSALVVVSEICKFN